MLILPLCRSHLNSIGLDVLLTQCVGSQVIEISSVSENVSPHFSSLPTEASDRPARGYLGFNWPRRSLCVRNLLIPCVHVSLSQMSGTDQRGSLNPSNTRISWGGMCLLWLPRDKGEHDTTGSSQGLWPEPWSKGFVPLILDSFLTLRKTIAFAICAISGLFHMSPGGRETLEKADIRSLKNSNSPGFLSTTWEARSPHIVQNVRAEAKKSFHEERIPVTGGLGKGVGFNI